MTFLLAFMALVGLASAGEKSMCYQCATPNVEAVVENVKDSLWKTVPEYKADCAKNTTLTTIKKIDCDGQCMHQTISLADGKKGIIRGCVKELYKTFTPSEDGCHDNLNFVEMKAKTCFCSSDNCNMNSDSAGSGSARLPSIGSITLLVALATALLRR